MSQYTLHLGDCLEYMKTLPDGSVDAVVTDPPYPAEFSYLWDGLGRESARLLKVGGSLITLCGHYQVPDVIAALSPHLRYWWILSMNHRTLKRMPGKWVCIQHKPALWYVKERRRVGDTNCPIDSFMGGTSDDFAASKKLHKWGQPIAWFQHYIERLTDEGDTILDPFLGSGTTGVAALRTGRKFIGVELDANSYAIAKNRIENAIPQPALVAA